MLFDIRTYWWNNKREIKFREREREKQEEKKREKYTTDVYNKKHNIYIYIYMNLLHAKLYYNKMAGIIQTF